MERRISSVCWGGTPFFLATLRILILAFVIRTSSLLDAAGCAKARAASVQNNDSARSGTRILVSVLGMGAGGSIIKIPSGMSDPIRLESRRF